MKLKTFSQDAFSCSQFAPDYIGKKHCAFTQPGKVYAGLYQLTLPSANKNLYDLKNG
jgi:hypothetical protein